MKLVDNANDPIREKWTLFYSKINHINRYKQKHETPGVGVGMGVGLRGVSQWLEGWRLQSRNHGDGLSVGESKLQARTSAKKAKPLSVLSPCLAQGEPWAPEGGLGKTCLWNPVSFIFLHLQFLEKKELTI